MGERRIWTRKRGKLSKEAMSIKRMDHFGSALGVLVTPCGAECGPWAAAPITRSCYSCRNSDPHSSPSGFPWWLSGKEFTCSAGATRDGGSIPWRKAWQSPPVFVRRDSHGQEDPGELQSIGWQRVGHAWSDLARTYTMPAECVWMSHDLSSDS